MPHRKTFTISRFQYFDPLSSTLFLLNPVSARYLNTMFTISQNALIPSPSNHAEEAVGGPSISFSHNQRIAIAKPICKIAGMHRTTTHRNTTIAARKTRPTTTTIL